MSTEAPGRAAFEAWARDQSYPTLQWGFIFPIWQASRAAALEDCLKAIEAERLVEPTALDGDVAYGFAIDDCEAALTALKEPAK